MARILIIDDDPAMVQVISDLCSEAGHSPIAYSSGQRALGLMLSHSPQLIISDVRMEGVSGLEVLRAAKASLPGVPVILVTGSKQLELTVEAIRSGASDYILKPFKVDELKSAVDRALENASHAVPQPQPGPVAYAGYAANADAGHREPMRFESIVGQSVRMKEVFELVEKVANTDSTILILGESGTGKELIARALHYKSARRGHPFVAINCSALPENLLESELFGHKKGSFTGAVQDKVGLFEEAEGGTIFLDEINSMAPLLQTKLLRVLQERMVRRVGDNRNVPIHVRVLAATNEPLYEKMKTGSFRQDLYYRLAVIPVEMPSLRERQDDIPLLVEHFLRKHTRAAVHDQPIQIEENALRTLCSYRWPGNVRELENAMERACALCDNGVVRTRDLPPHVVKAESVPAGGFGGGAPVPVVAAAVLPVGATLDEFISGQERRFIEETIRLNKGVREKAAQMLGISTATLYRKLDSERKLQTRKGADA